MQLFRLNASGEEFLPSASRQVGCLMAYPRDEMKRGALFDAWRVHAFQLFLSRQGDRVIPMPAQFVQQISKYGGVEDLSKRIGNEVMCAMEAGDIVGQIFLTALQHKHVCNKSTNPSMATLLKSVTTEKVTSERRAIYEYFSPVAHYWAAWVLLKGVYDEGWNAIYTQFPCTDSQLPWFLFCGRSFLESMDGYRTRDGVALCNQETAYVVDSPADEVRVPSIEIEDLSDSVKKILDEKRGAPAKYDWPSFNARLMELFAERGLPSKGGKRGWRSQGDARLVMEDWCEASGWNIRTISRSTLMLKIGEGVRQFQESKLSDNS